MLFYGFSDRVLFDISEYEEKIRGILNVSVAHNILQFIPGQELPDTINTPEDTAVLKKSIEEIVDRKQLAQTLKAETQKFNSPQLADAQPATQPLQYQAPALTAARDFKMDVTGGTAVEDTLTPPELAGGAPAVTVPKVRKVTTGQFAAVISKERIKKEEEERSVPTFIAAAPGAAPAFFVREGTDGSFNPSYANALVFQNDTLPLAEQLNAIGVGKGEIKATGTLSNHLHAQYAVFKLPDEDTEYVRIRLTPTEKMPVPLPKDVLFLIDVSGSITPDDIMKVQFDVWNSLAALGPQDRFNIILFSVTQEQLYDSFKPVSAEAMRDVQHFIKRLGGSRETDIYDALMKVVPFLHAGERVTHIIFMSDAKPTEGERDFRRIINDFTRNRVGNVAFFTFDVGDVKDKLLLDYLAYENRGVAFHRDSFSLGDYHLDMVMKAYAHPLFYDVRIDDVLLEGGELFPRLMPHVYEGRSIDVYARLPYRGALAFTVSGMDAGGMRRSMRVALNTDGSALSHDATIMAEWAHFKLFELISIAFREGMSPAINKQIAALKSKYNIIIPRELSRYLR